MASPLVSDKLWAVIEPLLPVIPARPKGGRPRISDRSALTGIVFVLLTGIPWEMLPREMGCGSGIICWRRLRDRHQGGRMGQFASYDADPPPSGRPTGLEPGLHG